MLFNHDLYKPHTDQTYFTNYATFELREDKPIVFVKTDGDEYIVDTSIEQTETS